MANKAYKILEDIFTNQITVLNIAVPTTALDLESAKNACLDNNFDIHLVKEPDKENLELYVKKSGAVRALNDSEVISESTPILEVLEELCEKEQLFVKVKRNITHLVARSDLDTIPVRIWLYGMISLFEIELKEKINQLVKNWKTKLSKGRVSKAKELYDLKKSRNEEIDLLGCTQLVDLGTIVFRSWGIFAEYFPENHPQNEIRSSFTKINGLRDALAHGQKLTMEWPEIYGLAELISYSLRKI